MRKKSGSPPLSSDPEIQEFMVHAECGLRGLVAKALNVDGDPVLMDAFIEGRLIVQIDVLFSWRGMSAEAYYIANGVRGGLFGIRDQTHSATADSPAPPSPTPLRLVFSRKATK